MNLNTATQSRRRSCPGASAIGEKGFTLVEVMISLAVLSLVMLTTVSSLRTFANTQGSLERKINRIDEIRSVSSFLREALQANVPAAEEESGGLSLGGSVSQTAFFRGSPRSVEWKAPMVFGEGYGGTLFVRLAWENDQLVLRWQEPPTDGKDSEPDWADTQSRVVIDHVEAFSISYRQEFEDNWREGLVIDEAPMMLRLSIKSSGRYWPDLIAGVNR
ncbi:MAG: prepilin-type N-terminal cleavage/methylation domain-containing protein [Halieaceae bacterium]